MHLKRNTPNSAVPYLQQPLDKLKLKTTWVVHIQNPEKKTKNRKVTVTLTQKDISNTFYFLKAYI